MDGFGWDTSQKDETVSVSRVGIVKNIPKKRGINEGRRGRFATDPLNGRGGGVGLQHTP